jgi:23S rRNA (pseudouridine1915-N3)-methyltransferase
MRITVVSYQGSRASDLAQAEGEYVKRLSRHAEVELLPLRAWDERTGLPARLLRATWRIGLFVDGRQWDSEGMALRLQELMNQGHSQLVWVIGSAEGMPPQAALQVQERWSLTRLTLGHRLARLVLLEALYRSFDLLHGGPYHK